MHQEFNKGGSTPPPAAAIDNREERSSVEMNREFIERFVHDLRGALSPVKGFAILMKDQALPLPEREEYVQNMVQAVEVSLQLTNHLLDFALLAEGSRDPADDIDLQQVVEYAVRQLQSPARARSVRIDLEVAGDGFLLRGDSTRVYRSIWNLLDNAISHSRKDTVISAQLTFDKDQAVFKVLDFGPGIPADGLAGIFDQFHGADIARGKPMFHGLGLALVKATAVAHHGEVSARNVEGAGAEFTLIFPSKADHLRLEMYSPDV